MTSAPPIRRRRRRSSPTEPTSWVYFAEVGPYIKVGFSRNPQRRVERLFSSATTPPEGTPRDRASRRLLKIVPGDLSDERAMHAALSDFCVDREWFLNEYAVRRFIDAVRPGRSYPKITRPNGPYMRPHLDVAPEVLEAVFGGPRLTRRRP